MDRRHYERLRACRELLPAGSLIRRYLDETNEQMVFEDASKLLGRVSRATVDRLYWTDRPTLELVYEMVSKLDTITQTIACMELSDVEKLDDGDIVLMLGAAQAYFRALVDFDDSTNSGC